MARLFARGGGDKLQASSAVLTAAPLTLACWFQATALDNAHRLISLTDGSTNNRFQLGISVANAVLALTASGGSSANAASTTSISAGVWYHCAAVFVSPTSRMAYLNAAGKATNATSLTPSGINTTALGYDGTTTTNGTIAVPAVWNVALSADEITSLAAGRLCPNLVRPDALVAYWKLDGGVNPEPDSVGSVNLTAGGNPTQAADPPGLFYTRKTDNTSSVTNRLQPVSTQRGGYFRLEIGDGISGTWLTYGTATDLDDAEAAAIAASVAMGKPVRIIPVRSNGMDEAELGVYSRGQG